MSAIARDTEEDLAKAAAKDAAEAAAKKEAAKAAEAGAAKALTGAEKDSALANAKKWVLANPKTALGAAALGAYMIDNGETDPVKAAADMAAEAAKGAGNTLNNFFGGLKPVLFALIGIPIILLLIYFLYKLISSKTNK